MGLDWARFGGGSGGLGGHLRGFGEGGLGSRCWDVGIGMVPGMAAGGILAHRLIMVRECEGKEQGGSVSKAYLTLPGTSLRKWCSFGNIPVLADATTDAPTTWRAGNGRGS